MAAGIYAMIFDPNATNIEEIEQYRISDSHLDSDAWDHIYVNSDEMKIGELTYDDPTYNWLAIDFKTGCIIDDIIIEKVKKVYTYYHCAPDQHLIEFLKRYKEMILVIWIL